MNTGKGLVKQLRHFDGAVVADVVFQHIQKADLLAAQVGTGRQNRQTFQRLPGYPYRSGFAEFESQWFSCGGRNFRRLLLKIFKIGPVIEDTELVFIFAGTKQV